MHNLGIVVVAAGQSRRMGFDKIWAELDGVPVLGWSLRSLASCPHEHMVVVVSSAQMEPARELVRAMGLSVTVVRGGARRRDSVLMGLDAMRDVKWIAVHDAARPLVSADLLQRGFSAAEGSGVAVPVIPVSDTIKRVEGDRVVGTVPRADLRAVQTPQIFRRDILAWALSTSDDDVTDEAGLVESLGGIVYTFRGDPVNFKLTYPEDLLLMREILRRPAMDAR